MSRGLRIFVLQFTRFTFFERHLRLKNHETKLASTKKNQINYFLNHRCTLFQSKYLQDFFFFEFSAEQTKARPFYFSSIYMGYDNINDIQILHFLRLYALNIHNP